MTKNRGFLAGLVISLIAMPVHAAKMTVLIPINPGVKINASPVSPPPVQEEESGGPVLEAWDLLASTLPEAETGKGYSFEFSTLLSFTPAEAALSGLAWSEDDLPDWLTLNASTGKISGTPNDEGEVTFNITATHGEEGSRTREYTIVINGVAYRVTQVAAGDDSFSCAITASGAAMCWGNNDYFQLGDGGGENGPKPRQVVGLTSGVTKISAGVDHACAVHNGAAKCWGYDDDGGKLGDGSYMESAVPVAVQGLGSGVSDISAGLSESCAVHNGGVVCWGEYMDPTPVPSLSSGVTAVDVGSAYQCAIHNGAAKCWMTGGNPAQILGLTSGVTDISVAGSRACAVHGGAVKCWNAGSIPVQVTGLESGATVVATGNSRSCAIQNGAAKCWSGNGPANSIVEGLDSGVTHIAASYGIGSTHVCAVHNEEAKCWGDNYYGQLGDGRENSSTPIKVKFQ